MREQRLQARPLRPEASIFTPGAAQGQVGRWLQLGACHQSGPEEICDLLGIGEVGLVPVQLPGLPHSECGKRIHNRVPLSILRELRGDGLPTNGRWPRTQISDGPTVGPTLTARSAASNSSKPAREWGIRNRVTRCPSASRMTT